jgi:hypothetical protein
MLIFKMVVVALSSSDIYSYYMSTEPLELGSLRAGDLVKITAEDDRDTYRYFLWVEKAGELAAAQFVQTVGGSEPIGPMPIKVVGSGMWTERQENPVQKARIAMSIDDDFIHPGDYFVFQRNDDPESGVKGSLWMEPAITEIAVERKGKGVIFDSRIPVPDTQPTRSQKFDPFRD